MSHAGALKALCYYRIRSSYIRGIREKAFKERRKNVARK